jgi:hypothetical protein
VMARDIFGELNAPIKILANPFENNRIALAAALLWTSHHPLMAVWSRPEIETDSTFRQLVARVDLTFDTDIACGLCSRSFVRNTNRKNALYRDLDAAFYEQNDPKSDSYRKQMAKRAFLDCTQRLSVDNTEDCKAAKAMVLEAFRPIIYYNINSRIFHEVVAYAKEYFPLDVHTACIAEIQRGIHEFKKACEEWTFE